MEILKRSTKKSKVRRRRQLRWRRKVHIKILMLDSKRKKVRRSCTDWLGRGTGRERCTAREGYEG